MPVEKPEIPVKPEPPERPDVKPPEKPDVGLPGKPGDRPGIKPPDRPERPEPTPVSASEEKKKEILVKMEACIKEYGQENNIPVTHEYWQLGNQFRAL
jgi:hypothetical protein